MKTTREMWEQIPQNVRNSAMARAISTEFWIRNELEPLKELVTICVLHGYSMSIEQIEELQTRLIEVAKRPGLDDT